MTLIELRDRSERLEVKFIQACEANGFANQWEVLRMALPWPQPIEDAWRAYNDAAHAFYLQRDGANGFLGGKGL